MTTNKEFKKFSIMSLILMGLSLVFTILLISFHFDISMLAFVISLLYVGITFYILGIEILKNTNGKHMLSLSRLVEFMPYVFFVAFILRRAGKFGTPFWYDFITVILWFAILVLSIIVSRKLDFKRAKKITEGWAVLPVEKEYKGPGKILFEIGDWIYAIVWAIFSVMLIQVFVIQLYEIPSESMVPTFLVKDRVIVSKIDCGPKFPLTDVGLPDFRKYKRGDTIVLRNPHYSMDRRSEVKTVTSQLVYMLTFMTVNLNTDENGEMKADPLVKRITGLPGEQLVMQDGVLYVRTEESNDFIPSKIDSQYATWNLNECAPEIYRNIRNPLFSNAQYEKMLALESERRELNLNKEVEKINDVLNDFKKSVRNIQINMDQGSFKVPSFHESMLFSNLDDIAYNIITQSGGREWFEKFVTSWINGIDNKRDIYQEANYRLNIMVKDVFAQLVSKYAKAFAAKDFNILQNDNDFINLLKKADLLNWYIQGLLDSRNMPVFPANDNLGNPQYIPKDCYFMMGDNRFNSLDLRHDYDRTEKALTNDDSMSVTYFSIINPQYVNKKYIIGKPIFTFWPLNRLGKV